MSSSSLAPRGRYPLFTGLLATLGACVLAAGLALWGSVEIQRQLDAALGDFLRLCGSAAPAAPEAMCAMLGEVEHTLRERAAVMLLLQALCFALILVGAGLLAQRGYALLVRRADAALGLAATTGAARGRDEIDRLVECLAELSARQAGLEAERRWRRQTTDEQLRRKNEALQSLHEAARMLCDDEVSSFSLVRGLALLEAALGARTVALCLDEGTRQSLGTAAVISTRGRPTIAGQLDRGHGTADATTRIVPPSATCPNPSLIVPMRRAGAFIGTLVAEFPQPARVEDPQVDLAESFSRLAALAIATVSRSQEERRIALMEERSAIAAELHDSLAQSLGFMKIQVARLQRRLDCDDATGETAQMARELREGLSAAYSEARELITAFRAPMNPGGLLANLQETIDELGQRSGLDVQFTCDTGRCHLEVNEELHVMQVVREALTNAARHAGARRVEVAVRYGPGHRFTVAVEDDGRGLDDRQAEGSHYGLSIMRERARSLGGELSVTPGPGGGTRVALAFAPQRLPVDTLEDASE